MHALRRVQDRRAHLHRRARPRPAVCSARCAVKCQQSTLLHATIPEQKMVWVTGLAASSTCIRPGTVSGTQAPNAPARNAGTRGGRYFKYRPPRGTFSFWFFLYRIYLAAKFCAHMWNYILHLCKKKFRIFCTDLDRQFVIQYRTGWTVFKIPSTPGTFIFLVLPLQNLFRFEISWRQAPLHSLSLSIFVEFLANIWIADLNVNVEPRGGL